MHPKKKTNGKVPPPSTTAKIVNINFPPLPPSLLLSSPYLSLTTLLQNQIYLIRNLFPTSLCTAYVNFLSSLPLSTTPGKPKKGEAVRVNDRFQVWDEQFARVLWERSGLKGIVERGVVEGVEGEDEGEQDISEEERRKQATELWGGEVVGLSPNIRIYRYRKGQFFDKHYDDSHTLSLPLPNPSSPNAHSTITKCHTTYTLLLYLTSATSSPRCIGGETVFYHDTHPITSSSKSKKVPVLEPISVAPQRGMALLHKHGSGCLLHEGRVVTEGEKWVVRSDLVVRG